EYVIYELHVGTFSAEGTFDGVIPYLGYLHGLGVTAVEIMPIAQFPGGRNWGYDGVLPYAAQDTYGGPNRFRRLVDACHNAGLAVVLDVVYNHLGPEGNYLADFGPYFTDKYRTPWGQALNFDGPDSDHVRNYFIQNALYWTMDCHVDALRLDAVHAILDHAAYRFIEELGARVHEAAAQAGRSVYLIAESSDNDARLITSQEANGYGMDAQWADDFHHAVHTLITGERAGYYADYGRIEHLAEAYREGFVYTGQYAPYRRRRHGTRPAGVPGERFVICVQNHDQVGNRLLGERLSVLVPFEAQKLAAASMLLAPFVPMLFMGEEYGETAPFQYFMSHTDADLVEAVRKGRKEEFEDFGWAEEPPDPQSPATFEACKLGHALRQSGKHADLLAFYRDLLALRRSIPALAHLDKQAQAVAVVTGTQLLAVHRWHGSSEAFALFNYSGQSVEAHAPVPAGRWKRALDSAGGVTGTSGADLFPPPRGGELPVALAPYQAVLFVNDAHLSDSEAAEA
ncbi:MAG: malto-oligosyltrehalose trehalohydrolase, partial [Dehalococcoidia bacterium]